MSAAAVPSPTEDVHEEPPAATNGAAGGWTLRVKDLAGGFVELFRRQSVRRSDVVVTGPVGAGHAVYGVHRVNLPLKG